MSKIGIGWAEERGRWRALRVKIDPAMRRNPNIGILNSPIYSANERIFLDKHIRTLEPICNEIFVVTGNYPIRYGKNVHIIEIESGRTRIRKPSPLVRIAHQLLVQIKLTLHLIKLSKNFDIVLFDIGEYRNVLPVLSSKLLRKKTLVIHLGGNKSLESRIEDPSGWQKIIPPILDCLMRICYSLVDNILCIAPSIVRFGELERYKDKIMIYGGEYVDTHRFQIQAVPDKREALVGYAGRLSLKKGVINLVRAVPLVLKECPVVKFIIAGSGEEKDAIVKEIEEIGLKDKVTFSFWIPDEEFPSYLNRLKLFVLPSYEEGVPVTLKEAMACGAIVLATPVGGIPDMIKDGETGFLLRGNSPECIAKSILKALNHSHLEKIALKARSLIEKESSFPATVKRWENILTKLDERLGT